MRRGLDLREMDIAMEEDHDRNLAMPPLTGEVPKEWADSWWLKKQEKAKHSMHPFILSIMAGLADEYEEDIYDEA